MAAVRAIIEVESAGQGFGEDNRPIILYEPHVFYRLLGPGDERDFAVENKIAYPKWGTLPYPKTQSRRYEQVMFAMAIDMEIAFRSTSWGLGQTMGFNHRLCGYQNAVELVEGAKKSEGEQLMAMVRFIKGTRLDIHVQRKDWAKFARGYNGPGFAKNLYDSKLATSYARNLVINETSPERHGD